MKPTILALDLEGTLISNAISQIPRPGLYPFLEDVHEHFDQLLMFTTVPEDRFRSIAALLVREESAPSWFAELRCVNWKGKTKDLLLASPQLGSALLLDDHGPYVHQGQEHLWVQIPLFGSPYMPDDDGLRIALERLHERLRGADQFGAPFQGGGI
ncbi:NIF family HAD-type phosphatase [Stenotrophomonas maltophilia]|uniref:NIF family HAD-type phosphatase n=1 Tax=Stenotrophomonas maltophilia TaxID=40324 RepID=UPI002B1CB5DA|nr:NIF family HAD-type phosphatase [Stenotrophomonas maltophilia]